VRPGQHGTARQRQRAQVRQRLRGQVGPGCGQMPCCVVGDEFRHRPAVLRPTEPAGQEGEQRADHDEAVGAHPRSAVVAHAHPLSVASAAPLVVLGN
jgi:hypothetical protein